MTGVSSRMPATLEQTATHRTGAADRLPGTGAPPPAPATPLRVMDVTDTYSDTVSGGVKTYLHAKMEAFEDRRVRHSVVVPGPDTRVDVHAGSRLYRLRGPRVPVSPAYRFMLSPEALRHAVWEEQPHVLEVGSPFIVPWLVHRALRGLETRTVGFYHADIVRTFAEPYVPHRAAAPLRVLARTAARKLVRRVYDRFDVTVASSASVAAELRGLGLRDVREVPLGVDLATFRPLPPEQAVDRRTLGIDEDVPVGIFVGRFCAEKRLDVLLDGHGRIPAAERPHLLLVGGGPHLEKLRKLAAERERLTIHPYVQDRRELARLYATADFYCASGPGETFGLSIAEAMACGLPVHVVDRGAAPDRVAGSGCGFPYVHGDGASAAQALRDLSAELAASGDELSRRAHAHAVRTYDWSRSFDLLLDLYTELAAGPPRR